MISEALKDNLITQTHMLWSLRVFTAQCYWVKNASQDRLNTPNGNINTHGSPIADKFLEQSLSYIIGTVRPCSHQILFPFLCVFPLRINRSFHVVYDYWNIQCIFGISLTNSCRKAEHFKHWSFLSVWYSYFMVINIAQSGTCRVHILQILIAG